LATLLLRATWRAMKVNRWHTYQGMGGKDSVGWVAKATFPLQVRVEHTC
jgi:hypothetical protein